MSAQGCQEVVGEKCQINWIIKELLWHAGRRVCSGLSGRILRKESNYSFFWGEKRMLRVARKSSQKISNHLLGRENYVQGCQEIVSEKCLNSRFF